MDDKNLTGRERLEKAFEQFDVLYLEKYPPTEGNIEYSEQYLKNMQKLIKLSRSAFYMYLTTSRNCFAIIAVSVLLVIGYTMSASVIRAPIIDFFAKITEKFTELFF